RLAADGASAVRDDRRRKTFTTQALRHRVIVVFATLLSVGPTSTIRRNSVLRRNAGRSCCIAPGLRRRHQSPDAGARHRSNRGVGRTCESQAVAAGDYQQYAFLLGRSRPQRDRRASWSGGVAHRRTSRYLRPPRGGVGPDHRVGWHAAAAPIGGQRACAEDVCGGGEAACAGSTGLRTGRVHRGRSLGSGTGGCLIPNRKRSPAVPEFGAWTMLGKCLALSPVMTGSWSRSWTPPWPTRRGAAVSGWSASQDALLAASACSPSINW